MHIEKSVDVYKGIDPLTDAIWNMFSKSVQEAKLNTAHIFNEQDRNDIIDDLKTRPSFLASTAKFFFPNRDIVFAEVGTAQGMQSAVFSRHFLTSQIYTCDIIDVASPHLKNMQNVHSVLGDSNDMCNLIKSHNNTVDFFWIDGNHDRHAVIQDVKNLMSVASHDSIWAFDDFDKRFGCFSDIVEIINKSKEHAVIEIGRTASGLPNVIVLMRGIAI